MSASYWTDTFVTIGRSRLEHDIWVPSIPDDDCECFEYAGHQYRVRAWVISQQLASWARTNQPKTRADFKWVRIDDNTLSLRVCVTE